MMKQEDLDRLLKAVSLVESLVRAGNKPEDAEKRIPRLVTMKEIKELWGIGINVWREGVKSGIYPQPVSGMTHPKRWCSELVRDVLRSAA